MQVKWRGLADNETDWVDVNTLREDVPALLEKYLSDLSDNGTLYEQRLVKTI